MRILVSLLAAALVLASASVAASPDFTLRRATQTRTTLTLEWDRQRGADGYRFVRNGVVVASTRDASTTSVTFWKGRRYAVEVLRKSTDGRMTRVKRATFRSTDTTTSRRGRAPLVFVRAPSAPFKLRVTATTPSKVTFAWRRQPGADGYRFVRNGVVVAKTLDSKTTSVTFWKGRRYAVDALRVTPSKQTVTLRR